MPNPLPQPADKPEPSRRPPPGKAFNLSRWFAIVGLISITLISVVAALLLSRFLTDHMLRQEAVLTMEFVQSVVITGDSQRYFEHGDTARDRAQVEKVFEHIAQMQDVLRANVYSRDKTVIWSSNPDIIGKRFDDNDELDDSLAGRLVVHDEGSSNPAIIPKAEHQDLDRNINYFVEIYLPVWDQQRNRILGVVELYKRPRALFEAIQVGKFWIWTSAAVGGFAFYLALFSLIRRADNLIQTQQDKIVENETLAAVGEMGTAVAHGIRNPLTAIRSSAELCLEGEPELSKEAGRDIMSEVDRLEVWVRELLSYSRPVSGRFEPIPLPPVLEQCLGHFAREMEKRNIRSGLEIDGDLPRIRADAALLGQVVTSLIANAMEAMKSDGSIRVTGEHLGTQKQVRVAIRDTGPGMSRDELARVFKPFYTTKPKGLGVGLPLTKRIVERFGGRIEIESQPGRGTTVLLTFPAAN